MIDKLGGRKFVLTVFGIILSFVLVLVGKLEASQWLTFVFGTGSVYVGGNIASKLTTKIDEGN